MLLPEGLLPGSYTPFTPDNRLDEKVLGERLQSVVKGSGGLHGPAGHSEFASLTFDEWKVWTDVMIEVAHKAKLPAWSFFGTESFEKTLPYAEYAKQAGADGFFIIAPYFNKYGQDEAYQYYKDLAGDYSDTPIIFYPSHQTGNHFAPSTIEKIAEIPNIVGMKLNGDFSFDQFGEIIMRTRRNKTFRWVAGGLNVLYPLTCHIGFKASCSPSSNFSHEWSVKFWEAYQARNWEEAEKWSEKLERITNAVITGGDRHLTRGGNKAAMELLGKPVGYVRRPAKQPTAEQIAKIRKVFKEEGLL
jgi:4-hydroxy-tetrahydrodipicolinate synthase